MYGDRISRVASLQEGVQHRSFIGASDEPAQVSHEESLQHHMPAVALDRMQGPNIGGYGVCMWVCMQRGSYRDM